MDAKVANPVVLTGDVHRHWANDVKTDWTDPDSPVVASELVCSSVTSSGNGSHSTTSPNQATNPHLKFFNDDRGYVSTTITPSSMTAHYRVVEDVRTPGAPVLTRASFRLDDGQRGLQHA